MIELHAHSTISDGSLDLYNLINTAEENGVKYLALTDHDTTAGIEKALNFADLFELELIPGIEISAQNRDGSSRVHILAYYIDPDADSIKEISEYVSESRNRAAEEMFLKIRKMGYQILWSDLKKYSNSKVVYKQHIMHALMDAGYCRGIYNGLYKKLFSRKNGEVFTEVDYIDVFTAIKSVRDAGGVPVIAHPGELDNFDLIAELAANGLEGIEVKHPSHNEKMEKKSIYLAEKFDLIQTGGSDYHGFYGNHNYKLGSKSPAADTVEKLKQRSEKINAQNK
ncbi:hypothetical protein C8C78_1133 [Halanaerobium congolense]|jgi:hypothetical protein|uniref:Polymerase/histidinol phosphatase N-terminal domain-containing protein n=1 Tax=Halanaerobium congolense TaxID=54121 RepID=A0A318E320_9FIRM|nr:PHP domain-containing protein [Halanaerobium congolense]PXV65558.1 hypothetical protein C8C78_1133 [Halanaerobium congolense]